MIPSRKYLLAALLGGLVLSLAACGRSDSKPVYPVTGTVLCKAKPAEGAQVVFIPLDNAEPKMPQPGGQVRKNGSFRLSTFRSYDGAPAGRYAVTIVYPSPEQKVNDENMGPDLLEGRFADPKTTPLRAEVKQEATKLEPFDLQ
jgi:hypothetical protein